MSRTALRAPDRWLALFLVTRAVAVAVAVALLAAHYVTAYDPTLIAAVLAWGVISLAVAARAPALRHHPLAWLVDAAACLALISSTGDFRSPFYLLLLTTLVFPCTDTRRLVGVGWSIALAGAYLGVAVWLGLLQPRTLGVTVRLETIATHLMVPVLVGAALAYGADILSRLHDERERSERLAIEAERKRIAWDLHDSAKQRVHAAHLLLSAIEPRVEEGDRDALAQALGELRAAAGDMATSVAELRSPLEDKPLTVALHRRAAELARSTEARISVRGRAPELAPLVASHAYRIAAEALSNAVRHAGAEHIEVVVEPADGALRLAIRDDGIGPPPPAAPAGSNGLRSMRNRAEAIGARLAIGPAERGRGTTVLLTIPLEEGATA